MNKMSLPPGWLVRILTFFQRFFQPVFNPNKLPFKFPKIEVVTVNNPYRGTLLFTNATNPFQNKIKSFNSYITEVDKYSGKVLLYRRILTKAYLFQSQPEGYSYGILEKIGINGGGHDGTHYLTNCKLKTIKRFRVVGLPHCTTDMHEFLRLENDNVLILSYKSRQADLSSIGGSKKALVYDPVIVEQTIENEIVWCWDGEQYFDIRDIVNSVRSPDVRINAIPPLHVDYAHANALSLFPDGNLLLSLKHLNCLIKINRQTKTVIWRMSSVNDEKNQFTFLDDTENGFSHQHSTRILPNNNLLLFDNGTLNSKKESRAVEYEIDDLKFTAKLIWSYSNHQYTPAQRSIERLPNGNTLIGWGFATEPFVSEITPQGKVALAIKLPQGQIVYRVYQNRHKLENSTG